MSRRILILAIFTATIFVLMKACGYREDTLRYRLTVEVETPSGVRRGSAVREITLVTPPNIPFMLGESGSVWRIKGEAVPIELPGGRLLFALVVGENLNSLQPTDQMSSLLQKNGSGLHEPIEIWSNSQRQQNSKFGTFMPMLITFENIKDKSTAKVVEPRALDEEFGPKIKLGKMIVERTDDPVTSGIEEYLPWMKNARNTTLDGSLFTRTRPEKIYQSISYFHLSTELSN